MTASPQPSGVPAAKSSVASLAIESLSARLTRLAHPRMTSVPSQVDAGQPERRGRDRACAATSAALNAGADRVRSVRASGRRSPTAWMFDGPPRPAAEHAARSRLPPAGRPCSTPRRRSQ